MASTINRSYLRLLALILAVFFCVLGWKCYIADSEIWSVTLATHFLQDAGKPWVASRVLFYGLLGIFAPLSPGPIGPFLACRAVQILNGLLILFLTFRITRRLSRSQLTPWIAVILLVGNTGFLNQGFRIRSDLFTCTVALWLLSGLVEESPSRRRFLRTRWVLLAFTTPKAFFQMIAFLLSFGAQLLPTKRTLRKWGWAIGLAALLGALGAWKVYAGSLIYFIHSFESSHGGVPYFSPESFTYLFRVIYQNPVFSLSVLAGFIFEFRKLRENPALSSSFVLYLTLLMLSMIVAPEKFPFFLASLLPFFCILAALPYDLLEKRTPIGVLCAATLIFLPACYWGVENLRHNSNSDQLSASRTLDSYLERHPGASHYDIIGIVPKKTAIRNFIGPHESANSSTFELLRKNPPDLFFFVFKAFLLEPQLSFFLKTHYIDLGRGVYAKARPIRELDRKSSDEVAVEVSTKTGLQETRIGRANRLKEIVKKGEVARRFSRFLPPQPPLSRNLWELFAFDAAF